MRSKYIRKMASERRVITLEIRSFHELVQRAAINSDKIIQIDVPVDMKVSEYKKIVEFADVRGYLVLNETEKLKAMMLKRNQEMKMIDETIDELQRMVDHIDWKMNCSP